MDVASLPLPTRAGLVRVENRVYFVWSNGHHGDPDTLTQQKYLSCAADPDAIREARDTILSDRRKELERVSVEFFRKRCAASLDDPSNEAELLQFMEFHAQELQRLRSLAGLDLPRTLREVFDLPYELAGGYVTLWCLDQGGLLTQRVTAARLSPRMGMWYVVAMKGNPTDPPVERLDELLKNGSAKLMISCLRFTEAWQAAKRCAHTLLELAHRDPQFSNITFLKDEE